MENQEKIKHLLKDVLYNSLSQAILKIVLTPHFILKIFLVICVLVSTGLASYLIIQSLMTYLKYGVVSSTRMVYETPTLFPKVTFCNLNPFTTEYAYNFMQKFPGDLEFYNKGIKLSDEEKSRLGHNLDDILMECSFNFELCFSSDFTWSFDPSYGNCYTFNSGFLDSSGSKTDLKKSSIAGARFGLALKVYVNYYEKLSYGIDYSGLIIRLGNSSYLTDDISNDGGILVSPSTSTNIAVNREFKSLQPRPYSNCELDSNSPKFIPGLDLYNLISQSDYMYTQQLCFFQCYQKYLLEKFNCTYEWFFSIYNATLCIGVFESEDDFNGKFLTKHCKHLCPLECDQILYKTSLSSSSMIENGYYLGRIKNNPNLSMDFINRTLDSQTVRESIVAVNIFYESLSYSLTTESPQMDVASLLGSIGGNLGLFLGISVFSICEVIEVVIEIILIFRKRNVMISI